MIKNLYNQYVDKPDRCILLLVGITVLLGVVFSLVNMFTTKFPGADYLPTSWLLLLPFMLIMLGVSWYFKSVAPRLTFFTRFYTLYFLATLAMSVLTTGMQYTPFATIDPILAHWDQALSVNTPAILQWTHLHPVIHKLLNYSYNGITIELFILPVLLGLCKMQRPMNEFLVTILFAFIVGGLIYYFFPTAAPVSIFDSPYFATAMQHTVLKFTQIHHHIQPTVADGGIISFPSFHVVYGTICIYVTRKRWWLLLPILCLNLIGIASTVMLGWHYLIDVFGGIALTAISVAFYHYFVQRHSWQFSRVKFNKKAVLY